MNIDELKAEVRAALDAADALVATAKAENRDLNDEEQVAYDQAVKLAEDRDADIKAAEARAAAEKRAAELRSSYASVIHVAPAEKSQKSELRSFIEAVGAGETRAVISMPTNIEQGGATLDNGFVIAQTPALSRVRVLPGEFRQQVIPLASLAGFTYNTVAPGATIPESGVSGSQSLTTVKRAAYTWLPHELIAAFPAAAEAEVRAGLTSSANADLAAIVGDAINDGATAGTGTVAADDLVALFGAFDTNYQGDAVWFVSPAGYAALLNLVDLNGRPVLMSDFSTGMTTLLGRPVISVPMNQHDVVLAHPRAITVVVSGLEISISEHRHHQEDSVSFRARYFAAGAVTDADYVVAVDAKA